MENIEMDKKKQNLITRDKCQLHGKAYLIKFWTSFVLIYKLCHCIH